MEPRHVGLVCSLFWNTSPAAQAFCTLGGNPILMFPWERRALQAKLRRELTYLTPKEVNIAREIIERLEYPPSELL